MAFDGHIHIKDGKIDRAEFVRRLHSAGMDGGVVLSMPPDSTLSGGRSYTAEERLENLFQWTGGKSKIYPFFWIDPTEPDALEQIELANRKGVYGYKVICTHFPPGDSRATKSYEAIAEAGKPILFHSGILWDGSPSSKYNRPAEFEALMEVKGLKFALAHVSWPWCDECIAVYGKFQNAYTRRPDFSVEMFIDITPGTPPIFREEVLAKLHTVGYDIESNIIFGSDCSANDYNANWTRGWLKRDNNIYERIGLDDKVTDKIYSQNLMRFLGVSGEHLRHKPLTVADT